MNNTWCLAEGSFLYENLVVFCVLCAAACLEDVGSDLLQLLVQLSKVLRCFLQGLVSVRPSLITEGRR